MDSQNTQQERFISTHEAALLFGYTNDYVSKLAREGKVVAQRVGKTWFVNEDALRRFTIETKTKEEQRLLKLKEERIVEYKSNGHKTSTTSAPRVIVSPVKKTSTFRAQITVAALGLFVFTSTFVTGFEAYKLSDNFFPSGTAQGAKPSPTVSKEMLDTKNNFSFSAPVTPSLVRAVQERAHDTIRAVSVPVPEHIESVYDVRTPKTILTLHDLHVAFLDAPILLYFSSVEFVNRYIESVAALSRSINKISVLVDQYITSAIVFQDRFVDHVTDLWIDRALIRDELVIDISNIAPTLFNRVSSSLLNIRNDYEPQAVFASAYIVQGFNSALSKAMHTLSVGIASTNDILNRAPSVLANVVNAFTFSPYVTKTSTVEYSDSFTWFEQLQYGFRSLFGQNLSPQEPIPNQESNPITATTTIVERIVDRTPTTVVNNITEAITVSGISSDELTSRLQSLENTLRSEIYLYSARAERGVSGNYRAIQLSQVINNLDGVTITNPIISGGSISGTSGVGATSLNGLSDVTLSGAAYGNVLLHNGTEWVNVATSSLGIVGGGSSFGQSFELTSGALAPTTTVGVIVSASSTITALSSTYGTTTNATSTNLFASNFTLGSLTGILRATAGSIATATIDLVNDVGSSILAIANGGTGWANLQANTLLLGNGTSRLATTSAGVNGQILSLVSGVPSWVATTTYNTGLTYSSGNVTVNTTQNIATLSNLTSDGVLYTSGGAGTLNVDASGLDVGRGGTGATTFTNNRLLTGNGTSALVDEANLTFDGSLLTVTGNASTTQLGSTGSSYFATAGGNVGIGTTSPWAKLAVNPVAGDINQFVVGSSTATSFLINTAGNVGIGTTTPTHTLTIQGGANYGIARINSTSANGESSLNFTSGDDGSNQGWLIGKNISLTNDEFSIFDSVNSLNRLTILRSGNIGIGTAVPAFAAGGLAGGIHIATSSSAATSGLRLDTGTADYELVSIGSNGNFGLYDHSAAAYRIYVAGTSGNIGIGTTTPQSKLSVVSGTNGTLFFPTGNWAAQVYNQDDNSTSGGLVVGNRWANNSSIVLDVGSLYGTGSAWTSFFTVKGGGNVGVGVTDPDTRLEVFETIAGNQLKLSYDATRYTALQVTSVGDLVIDAQGGDVSLLDENLFVCTGGACPAGPAGTGNLLVEGIFILPNGTAPTVTSAGAIAVDTSDDDQLVVADEGGTARVIQTKQKIWSVTVASTSPAFISAGLLAIPVELDGYTMTDIRCKVDSGTSKVIAVEDASANSTEDITCATTVTSDDGSITNATATAAEEMYIDFGATSGAVDTVSITVYGYWTRE